LRPPGLAFDDLGADSGQPVVTGLNRLRRREQGGAQRIVLLGADKPGS
jgi:hypothetical protein